jgi:hypothetical protein
MNRQSLRLTRKLDHRNKVLEVIDVQSQDMRRARHVVVSHQHRIAVRSALDRCVDAYRSARTRPVLDHHLLADGARQIFGSQTRDKVQSASGRKRNNEAHRPVRPSRVGR